MKREEGIYDRNFIVTTSEGHCAASQNTPQRIVLRAKNVFINFSSKEGHLYNFISIENKGFLLIVRYLNGKGPWFQNRAKCVNV